MLAAVTSPNVRPQCLSRFPILHQQCQRETGPLRIGVFDALHDANRWTEKLHYLPAVRRFPIFACNSSRKIALACLSNCPNECKGCGPCPRRFHTIYIPLLFIPLAGYRFGLCIAIVLRQAAILERELSSASARSLCWSGPFKKVFHPTILRRQCPVVELRACATCVGNKSSGFVISGTRMEKYHGLVSRS